LTRAVRAGLAALVLVGAASGVALLLVAGDASAAPAGPRTAPRPATGQYGENYEEVTVVMKDNPKHASGESKRRKIIDEFWIDYGRCMRCNICVEVCNFEAIGMNNTWAGHELSRYDRSELVLDLDQLLSQSKKHNVDPGLRA